MTPHLNESIAKGLTIGIQHLIRHKPCMTILGFKAGMFVWAGCLILFAGAIRAPAAEYVQAPASIAVGGGYSAGGPYRIQSEIGSSVAGTLEGGFYTHGMGFVAQLHEPEALHLAAGTTNLAEETSTGITAVLVLDDGTRLPLEAAAPRWEVLHGPLELVDGQAVAGAVYENTPARIGGEWQTLHGSVDLMVIDHDPDNFGSYAGDGLPDNWQVENYGLNNPEAAPDADPFRTGQNNWFKYIAGLDPADSNSVFQFEIRHGDDGAEIEFHPRLGSRDYAVEELVDLAGGIWQALEPAAVEDDGLTRTLIDTNRMRMRYYRVRITKP